MLVIGNCNGTLYNGAQAWIESLLRDTTPELRGPIERASGYVVAWTKSWLELPAVESRFMLIGLDGMLTAPTTDTFDWEFDQADGVLFLGAEDPALADRYLSERRDAIRGVASDWTTHAGACAAFETMARRVLERAAGR